MSQIIRLRERHSHPELTARKLAEIETIARSYQALRRQIIQDYWAPEQLTVVLQRPMSVVTARRKSGQARLNPLGSHYQAQAVLDGLDVVRGSWQQAFTTVRSLAAKKFTETERHELNWLLRWPTHLVTILTGGMAIPAGKDSMPITDLAANDHARLDRWLAAALRKCRPGQPGLKHKLALEIDSGSFQISERPGSKFPVWLSMSGLTKGKPLRIPMVGNDTKFLDGTANLRVSLLSDTKGRVRVVFRRAVKLEVAERTGFEIVGIDKGITVAITATSSDPEHALEFGTDYGQALAKHSKAKVRPGRSRYWSLAKNTADRQKAKNIQQHNLGRKRQDRATRRVQAHLANITGRSAREMVEAFPNAIKFVEEELSFSQRKGDHKKESQHKGQFKAPGVNRYLNSWTKRRLSRDIELHVSASGAGRQDVNAAYTSQACPDCYWTDSGNRQGQTFLCLHCRRAGRSDAVAASNVRARESDQTITRFTPYREVKQILLARHIAITDGRCPSRGCGSSMPAVSPAGSAANAAA